MTPPPSAGVEDILARLVGFKTLSRTDNVDLIDWVCAFLEPLGARFLRVPGAEAGRYNLLASIGPDTPGGIVLSGHSDVVPVEGQPWSTDPFCLTEHEGRLYGRGSSDMKGFLACMLVAARHAAALPGLRHPLHLAFSYDEEIGCVGVRSLLDTLQARGFQARGCVIGEPTGLRAVSGHKGKLAGCVTCHGLAAHSANPGLGCNAIGLGAAMVRAVEGLQEEIRQSSGQDPSYEVPYDTMQVGVIRGGVALNIVPDLCEIGFEMRLLPDHDPAPWLDRLQREADALCAGTPHARIALGVTNSYPGLHTQENAPFLQTVMQITGDRTPARIGFGTEGGLFRTMLDLPVVVCGPGSIDRAHKADEYITRAELHDGVAFTRALVAQLV